MAKSESVEGKENGPSSVWKDVRGKGAEILVFTGFEEFSKELRERGVEDDPAQLVRLDANYLHSTDRYLLLNVKDYERDPDNILFLNAESALVFTKKPWDPSSIKIFQKVLDKPYGPSTVVAFAVLQRVFDSHQKRFNELLERYKPLEQAFDEEEHAALSGAFERFYDRIDDFSTTLATLERQTIKEVQTKVISFYYSLLVVESNRLLERAETRMALLRSLASAYELKISRQLNERIGKLNDTIKILTAITIILMIPNVIAGHFGMNFRYMPEFDLWWAYPTVILVQVALVAAMFVVFRKKRYL